MIKRRVLRRSALVAGLSSLVLGVPAVSAQDAGDAWEDQAAASASGGSRGGSFRRVATFPVFLNTSEDQETVAEIVASAMGGTVLVYTDSETENIGFIDITDPASPQPAGVVAVSGEPTSVGVVGGYALAAINTSVDFVDTSGSLEVIDIASRQIVRSIDLGGQPDAVAVSPDGRYAAIAIENERDEDLGDGEPPQLPAGYLVIVDLVGGPGDWTARRVDLTGVADLFPEDPEPEFVDINEDNLAVVTLQENNHIAIVDLASGLVVNDFSAGTVNLRNVDIEENDLIDPTGSLRDVPREPDAVSWISPLVFATADEGDLFGGSRGFTTFGLWGGRPLYQAGSTVEQAVTRVGHYPENRSENKGNEPEGVEFGSYGDTDYLFVGSERSSVVLVYRLVGRFGRPKLQQILPTGVAPEGLHAIPERDLFVVACEDDARDDKIRSTIMIYERGGESAYPDIESKNRRGQTPIPWGALSGLASDPADERIVYTIHDSFYQQSRVYTMDVGHHPARIKSETPLVDRDGVLLNALTRLKNALPGADDFDPSAIVNADGTVNLDPEGIESLGEGRFIIASEGAGNLVGGVSDPDDRPFESPNMLVLVGEGGVIERVVFPPLELTENQFRFGFEGVAAARGYVYAAFQRAWQAAGDPAEHARIGRYNTDTGEWGFAYYPLDEAVSPNGGWVGLSEITALGGGRFLILERDNQGGPDARVKRVYAFSVDGVEFRPSDAAPRFEVLGKRLVRDLLVEGDFDASAGLIPEKLEGLAVVDGQILIVNDNDGVDDNSGETRLLRIDRD